IASRTAVAVEVSIPERRAESVRVEGVDTVIHRRYIENVVFPPGYPYIRGIEQSSVDLVVDRKHEQLPEMLRIDGSGGQGFLGQVGASALVVISPGKYLHAGPCKGGEVRHEVGNEC